MGNVQRANFKGIITIIHNLFYTLRVYIQYNKICSDSKIHGIAKALNFTNKC